jgi:hypothetical protein
MEASDGVEMSVEYSVVVWSFSLAKIGSALILNDCGDGAPLTTGPPR